MMLKHGVIDSSGRILTDGHTFCDRVSESEKGRIFSVIKDKIIITQQDVRQLQLTKAAIAAGIDALLAESNVETEELDEVIIAGGFGSYLDLQNAAEIGLFPKGLLDRMTVAGNTALSGCGPAYAFKRHKRKREPF